MLVYESNEGSRRQKLSSGSDLWILSANAGRPLNEENFARLVCKTDEKRSLVDARTQQKNKAHKCENATKNGSAALASATGARSSSERRTDAGRNKKWTRVGGLNRAFSTAFRENNGLRPRTVKVCWNTPCEKK